LILGSPSKHDDNNSNDDDGNNDDDDDDEDDRPGGEAGAFESYCSRSAIQAEYISKVIGKISCHRSHISFVVDTFYGDTKVGNNGKGQVFVVRRISCGSEGAPFRSI